MKKKAFERIETNLIDCPPNEEDRIGEGVWLTFSCTDPECSR